MIFRDDEVCDLVGIRTPRSDHPGRLTKGSLLVFSLILQAGYLISAQQEVCLTCHDAWAKLVQPSVHGQVGLACTDCHADLKDLTEDGHGDVPKKAVCAVCHEPEMVRHGKSVHSNPKPDKSGPAAACQDCHGSHEIKTFTDPAAWVARGRIIGTCGACHEAIKADYLEGVHGNDYTAGIQEVPVCTDCHSGHDTLSHDNPSSPSFVSRSATLCSRCHDDEVISKRYGLKASRLRSFARSFHGKASSAGVAKVANCASCHGNHNIRPSTDPKSSVNPANLPRTCGACHALAGKNFSRGRIHDAAAREGETGAYVIRVFYLVFIWGLMALFIFYIAADLFRRRASRWKKTDRIP